jgi:hypothetical protein
MELPNSRALVELGLDEMPSTLRVDSQVPHSPLAEMSPFHVILKFEWSFGCHTL